MTGPLLVVNLTLKFSGASVDFAFAFFSGAFAAGSFAAGSLAGSLAGSGAAAGGGAGGGIDLADSAGGDDFLSSAASLDGCELEQPNRISAAQAAASVLVRVFTVMPSHLFYCAQYSPAKKALPGVASPGKLHDD